MAREPLAYDAKGFVRGKSGQYPFAPGGLVDPVSDLPLRGADKEFQDIVKGVEQGYSLGRGGIRTVPPGFERGLDFETTDRDEYLLSSEEHVQVAPIYKPLASTIPNGHSVRFGRNSWSRAHLII